MTAVVGRALGPSATKLTVIPGSDAQPRIGKSGASGFDMSHRPGMKTVRLFQSPAEDGIASALDDRQLVGER